MSVEQSVRIHLRGRHLPLGGYRHHELSTIDDRLRAAVEGLGEYEGYETGPAETVFYIFGPDAEALYTRIEPILKTCPLTHDAIVIIRMGPEGAPRREVRISDEITSPDE